MPICVKDFTWEESETQVYITVPLKGVKSHKVDIFSSDEYIKAHYPPYLFECLLYAPVCDTDSTAQIGNGAVIFKLIKQEPAIWRQLQSQDADNKEFVKQKKEAAIEKSQHRAEELAKETSEKKRESEKYALTEMMKLESTDKQRIEQEKESERQKATDELEIWKEQQKQQALLEKQRMAQIHRLKDKERHRQEEENNKINSERTKHDIFGSGTKSVPSCPTRQSGKIEVTFTPRVFPTPVRESQTLQEEEWLRKQADAMRVAEIDNKDLSEEEKNPLWLKDKGDSFFKSGNYQAAVNAYSHAIRMDCRLPALFSNRSACHLKLGNHMKCIEDSSKALDLLTPPVAQNAASRCKTHVRRGTAFCQLELYVEGLQDYEAALKLDPGNDQLRADADKMRAVIQSGES